nr:ORF2 [Pineapple bacilliform CO virus]
MSLQEKRQNRAYKEALEETRNLWDTAVGFVDKGEIVANIGTITKQLNTVLYLLLDLSERISRLEKVAPPQTKDISKDLEKLQKQLSGLRISEEGGSNLKQKKVPLRVYRNPFEILKGEISTSK